MCYNAIICYNDDKYSFITNSKLKILIFGVGESSIQFLNTINTFDTYKRILITLFYNLLNFEVLLFNSISVLHVKVYACILYGVCKASPSNITHIISTQFT